jgi:hypothetical protein
MRKRLTQPNRAQARRFIEKLASAKAIDHAYIARSEARFPDQQGHHPDEATAVGVEELISRRSLPSVSSKRFEKLRSELASWNIEARSSKATPLAPPRFGTVRLFRGETDRLSQTRGPFEGTDRPSEARGNYFSDNPVVAGTYCQPAESPNGAPLRYVDVPRSVLDDSRTTRTEVAKQLKELDARAARRVRSDELPDIECHLDQEWAGRASKAPKVVEATRPGRGSSFLESTQWTFGREELDVTPDSMQAFVTVNYASSPAIADASTALPKSWRNPFGAKPRAYSCIEVAVPLQRDFVLYMRLGALPTSIDFLLAAVAGPRNSGVSKPDLAAIEQAFQSVEHIVMNSPAHKASQHNRSRLQASAKIAIARTSVAALSNVVVRNGLAPEVHGVGWDDEASVARKFLCANEPIALTSKTLGRVVVQLLDTATFKQLQTECIDMTMPTRVNGAVEQLPMQMVRGTTKRQSPKGTRPRLHKRTA